MDQTTKTAQSAAATTPFEDKFSAPIRVLGVGVLVLIIWSVDKLAVSMLPKGSSWRYIIGGIVISVGLAAVLFFINRFNKTNS